MLKAQRTFRILVVDDDPADARLLRELSKTLVHPHELHFVTDGVQALDFLHRRGDYDAAQRPNLILLDVNLPRLSGLETLAAIKNDPNLQVIPVIMLSTSAAARDVRESYECRANSYVVKPTDLEQSVKLIRAIESFWMEFVLTPEERPLSSAEKPRRKPAGERRSFARKFGCEEHESLLGDCRAAVREIIELYEQQLLAMAEGDIDSHRFDLLIHMANQKNQLAKYAYLQHIEEHGCGGTEQAATT